MRIASFDKQAIADTKRLVDVASLPPDAEIKPEWDAFVASLARPTTQRRIKALFERASAGWDSAAEAALAADKVSFAMRPIYELLAADGPLAKFRAEGDTVEGP